jgi:hypothetical protein
MSCLKRLSPTPTVEIDAVPAVLKAPTSCPILAHRAQRIRDFVGTARTCIIEIGRELIAAKEELNHGEWLPWLDKEFGWTEMTATRYMRVAGAFKSNTMLDFGVVSIDRGALYALAAPDVPQAARDQAVERAEAGEHITKAESERIIAEIDRLPVLPRSFGSRLWHRLGIPEHAVEGRESPVLELSQRRSTQLRF